MSKAETLGVGPCPQILLKEYSFDSRHKPAFTEEDVLNIFPVVKHVNPKASDAFHFFQSGQAKGQPGLQNLATSTTTKQKTKAQTGECWGAVLLGSLCCAGMRT